MGYNEYQNGRQKMIFLEKFAESRINNGGLFCSSHYMCDLRFFLFISGNLRLVRTLLIPSIQSDSSENKIMRNLS